MIDYQTYCAIREAHEREGLSGRQIAKRLGIHPETVSKWVKRLRYEQRKAPPRGSKIDAHKGAIVRLLETHPYSAAQLFARLREDGYD
ncbi:MAG: helix-turn-helix domain-containing protein, partial [Terriglobia bacterium]